MHHRNESDKGICVSKTGEGSSIKSGEEREGMRYEQLE